jgi:hypothetical protein
VKELYQLFPKGPAKVAARIAGIPKPAAASEDRRHPSKNRRHGRHHREGLDHHLEGIARGDLPGADHGQRRRAEGIEANLFFTFFGIDAIHKEAHHDHIKVATVGNPGLHVPTCSAACPACRR